MLENVAGLVNHDGGKTFKQIIKTLENELHYKVETKILDSADYGVPQHRKRIYIVGFSEKVSKSEKFAFEWPEKSKKKVGDRSIC